MSISSASRSLECFVSLACLEGLRVAYGPEIAYLLLLRHLRMELSLNAASDWEPSKMCILKCVAVRRTVGVMVWIERLY